MHSCTCPLQEPSNKQYFLHISKLLSSYSKYHDGVMVVSAIPASLTMQLHPPERVQASVAFVKHNPCDVTFEC